MVSLGAWRKQGGSSLGHEGIPVSPRDLLSTYSDHWIWLCGEEVGSGAQRLAHEARERPAELVSSASSSFWNPPVYPRFLGC